MLVALQLEVSLTKLCLKKLILWQLNWNRWCVNLRSKPTNQQMASFLRESQHQYTLPIVEFSIFFRSIVHTLQFNWFIEEKDQSLSLILKKRPDWLFILQVTQLEYLKSLYLRQHNNNNKKNIIVQYGNYHVRGAYM